MFQIKTDLSEYRATKNSLIGSKVTAIVSAIFFLSQVSIFSTYLLSVMLVLLIGRGIGITLRSLNSERLIVWINPFEYAQIKNLGPRCKPNPWNPSTFT